MSLEYDNEEEEIEYQITPEDFLQARKKEILKKSRWSIIIGLLGILISSLAIWAAINYYPEYVYEEGAVRESFFSLLLQNILFLLGLFFVIAGIWGIYEAKKLSLKDIIPTPEAVEFIQEGRAIRPYYSYILVGSLIAVTLFQVFTENVDSLIEIGNQSAEIAGLKKPLVWQGEYWRILTAATLHGIFPLHLYFNAQALYGFGSAIEYLSNRAHLAIVFLLSIIGGGLLSLFAMPETTSIGASGGIMGLIGYLAIYGSRRRSQLPPGFLRSMLVNIGFVAAFGLVAYQVVDNFGHLGGLIIGAVYGFLQVPKDLEKNPRKVRAATEFFGIISIGIFVFTAVLTILLLLQYIKF